MNDDNLGSASSAGSDRNNGVAWERATLEKLVFATIREQQAARRWKMFTRFMWLAILGAIVWFVYNSANMASAPSTPHTAVVEIKGAIASDSEASAENHVTNLRHGRCSKRLLNVIFCSTDHSAEEQGNCTDDDDDQLRSWSCIEDEV